MPPIEDIIAAVVNKTAGWQTLLSDNWNCIYKNYPQYLTLLELFASNGFGSSPNLSTPLINGVAIGTTYAGYGTGTNYTLTNTQAAIANGTTSAAITILEPGTYLVDASVHLDRVGATVVAETASYKVRRTNNTAADLSAVPVLDLPVSTTLTDTLGIYRVPPFLYTTANSNDALTLFGAVSATLGAGTIQAVGIGTFIMAQRLK